MIKSIILIIGFSLSLIGQVIKVDKGAMRLAGAITDIDLRTHVHGACVLYKYNSKSHTYKEYNTLSLGSDYVINKGSGFWVINPAKSSVNCLIDTGITKKIPPTQYIDSNGKIYKIVSLDGNLWITTDFALNYKDNQKDGSMLDKNNNRLYSHPAVLNFSMTDIKISMPTKSDWKKLFDKYGKELLVGGSTGLNLNSSSTSFCGEDKQCNSGDSRYWAYDASLKFDKDGKLVKNPNGGYAYDEASYVSIQSQEPYNKIHSEQNKNDFLSVRFMVK